jgi:DNA-binding response OmpR family regulator
VSDIVLFEPEAALLEASRALLALGGYRVLEAQDSAQATRALATSRAQRVVVRRATLEAHSAWATDLRATRPEVELIEHAHPAEGLLVSSTRADHASRLARDAVVFLGELAEQHGEKPDQTRTATRLAEATAAKLGLARGRMETSALAAALGALGPALVGFRLHCSSPPDAVDGISDGLKAAQTAAALLDGPLPLREALAAAEERFEGGGRPRGTSGDAIPIEARIVAVALRYARLRAAGKAQATAAEEVSARAGTDFDPRVTEAFFQALQGELLLLQLEGGGAATRGRVLLADGDASVRTLAEMRLRQAGFEVTTASDGPAAFKLIVSDPPDAVVADAKLPRLDGFALLLRLRRHEQGKRVPVLLLASRDRGMVDKALKLGAKDVLPKPLNYDLLLGKLRALTSRKANTTLAMQGSLSQISVSDCFQTLHLARRTARAQIESSAGRAEVYFENGQPIAAFTPSLKGEDAFSEVCGWTEGTFRIVAGEAAPDRNLFDGLYPLLMRAAKQLDEGTS